MPRTRPGWLIFAVVMALVMGTFTLVAVTEEFTSERVMNGQAGLLRALEAQPGQSEELRQLLAANHARLTEAATQGQAFLRLLTPLGGLAAVILIGGGIGCLLFRRRAPLLLLAGFALDLAYDVARVKPAFDRQLAMSSVMQSQVQQYGKLVHDTTERIIAGGGTLNAPIHVAQNILHMFEVWARLAAVVMMVVTVASMLLKVALLIAGTIYLRRPSVRALFARP
jgi:hypothetical protein